jgi:hypothetical protein
VRWRWQDEQARRRRPAGASAAPVILIFMRPVRVLIGAVAVLALGCGGSGATARTPAGSATPSATASGGAGSAAAVARPGLRLKRIGTFSSPVYLTAPPGDRHRLFVVEQGGRIRIVRDGKKLATPFLNVSGAISSGGERGLLSMAFSPSYRKTGLFYI